MRELLIQLKDIKDQLKLHRSETKQSFDALIQNSDSSFCDIEQLIEDYSKLDSAHSYLQFTIQMLESVTEKNL